MYNYYYLKICEHCIKLLLILRYRKEVKVFFHPSSTLRDYPKSSRMTSAQTHATNVQSLPCDWLLYEEMSRTGRFCHVKVVTVINPLTVALFSGPARLPMDVIYEAEGKRYFTYAYICIFFFIL